MLLLVALAAGGCRLSPGRPPAKPAEAGAPPDLLGQEFRDIVYKQAGLPLHLDLYLPHAAVYPAAPVVVFMHGGSFVSGSKSDVNDVTSGPIKEHLRRHGFAVASVQYRLLDGERLFPVNITDVRDAIRYLTAQAAHYGLDAARIATWGSSAGGTLALAAAYLEADLSPPDETLAAYDPTIFAAIDVNGPTDLVRSLDPAELNDGFSAYLRSTPATFFGAADPERLAAAVSPVRLAAAGAPPTLILHGTQDNVVDVSESERLAAVLQALDVPHRLFLLERAGHGLFPVDSRSSEAIRATVLDFLLDHLP